MHNAGEAGAGSRAAGFTFMEIIAVLAIMGVLVAMISAGHIVRASVPAEAAMLKAHLRYVQSLAVANNTVRWSVRLGEHDYELMRDGVASPISFPGENAARHDLPDGVHIIAGAGGVIEFDGWGAPVLSHVITLSDGVLSRSVQVIGFTGLIP